MRVMIVTTRIVLVGIGALSAACSADNQSMSQGNVSEQVASNAIGSDAFGSRVIASKNGLHLTQEHLDDAMKIQLEFSDQTAFTPDEYNEFETSLIEEFIADPQETIDFILEAAADIESDVQAATTPHLPNQAPVVDSQPKYSTIANGHLQLRQSIRVMSQDSRSNSQFAEQAFNTPSVNQLRSFFADSQISSSNSNAYSSGQRVFTFCADGTFNYYYGSSSGVSPTFGGGEASSIHEASARGYWDAYQENGNDAILMYSTDAGFADETINNSGLLPILIAAYQEDLIQMGQRGQPASPDMLLARNSISGCQ